MKVYLLAGEASGDLHGSNLAKAIRRLDPDCALKGWGGDLMAQAGVEITKHYRELAFMGFLEVIKNLRTIRRNFKISKHDILDFAPDVLVLIDYPGFNLRMAKWAKEKGIRVVYYISPQVWAWKEGRVKQVKKYVDDMLVILPFERDFYAERGVDVTFVGHPLLDELEQLPRKTTSDVKRIALLPGSRQQEINTMLPVMLQVVKRQKDQHFTLAAASSIDDDFYKQFDGIEHVQLVRNDTYQVLCDSDAALVTSGTATLEAGLLGTPLVVCYKGNPVSFWIAKRLVNVKFISLVNLIMDREVVKELIQSDMNASALDQELTKILDEGPTREALMNDLKELHTKCGGAGASERAARIVLKIPAAQ